MERPTHTVDGRECRDFAATVAEFNRVLARWWGGDYWDGHLDVFNDILDWVEDCGPYTLVWSHSSAARDGLGHPAMAAWLTNKLGQCSPGLDREWRKQLDRAERGRGPTLFDWLVEIIADHGQIELRLQ